MHKKIIGYLAKKEVFKEYKKIIELYNKALQSQVQINTSYIDSEFYDDLSNTVKTNIDILHNNIKALSLIVDDKEAYHFKEIIIDSTNKESQVEHFNIVGTKPRVFEVKENPNIYLKFDYFKSSISNTILTVFCKEETKSSTSSTEEYEPYFSIELNKLDKIKSGKFNDKAKAKILKLIKKKKEFLIKSLISSILEVMPDNEKVLSDFLDIEDRSLRNKVILVSKLKFFIRYHNPQFLKGLILFKGNKIPEGTTEFLENIKQEHFDYLILNK
jgi:hypothetical protein